MKRVVVPELLDTDAGTPAEVQGSLADLRMFNRWFGGAGTSYNLFRKVAKARNLHRISCLEVAAGSGYVPAVVRDRLRQDGIELQITLLDRALTHLNHGAQRVVGDALHLPFRDGTFDLISSGLFAHHLEPAQVISFVNESLRVARVAVLVNDLIRDPLHLALVYAGLPLYRSRLTRHDAPASVRRAYTVVEMNEMLRQTEAARVEIELHYLFRMGVIAWRK
jgi:ubiquinone/menaquinone biosynthesis C-methylase UbiE